MTSESTVIDTNRVAARHRADYWRDVISSTFVALDCDIPHPRDFGGLLRSNDLHDIRFSTVTTHAQHVVRSPSRIRQSPEEYFLVSIQLEGEGSVIQSDRCARLRPGDFSLYDTAHPYELRFERSFEQLVLRIPRPLLARRVPSPERLTAISFRADRGGAVAVVSDFARSVYRQLPELDCSGRAVLHQTFMDLLVWGIGDGASGQSDCGSISRQALRQRIKYFVDARLSDSSLDCQQIATAHGISVRYLNKIFDDEGGSIIRWMWSRRLERAKAAVHAVGRNGGSLTRIALDCGFKNPAHFSRLFKLTYGRPPSILARAPAR